MTETQLKSMNEHKCSTFDQYAAYPGYFNKPVKYLTQVTDEKDRIIFKSVDPTEVKMLFNFIFGFRLVNGTIEPDKEIKPTLVSNKLFSLRMHKG